MTAKKTDIQKPEKLIGIAIICVLIVIITGILIKQSYYDITAYGIVPGEKDASQSSDIIFEKLDFTPYIAPGYTLMLSGKTYDIKTLYEKINGKAPLYLEAGFRKLVTQRIASREKKSLWFEIYIYDMTSQLNAFSVYSQQRRTDARQLPGIEIAYQTENAVFFIKGPYYVELVGSDTSGALSYPLMHTARKIAADLLRTPVIKIPELSLLQKPEIIPGSTRLYLSNAFGFSALTNTFTGKIKFRDRSTTIFFSRQGSPAEAKTIAKKYAGFLEDNDGTVKSKKDGTALIEIFNMYEGIFTMGPYIAGVHEAETGKEAEAGIKYLKGLLDKNQTGAPDGQSGQK